jgi:DNA-directed RNA polymerase specialized sigma24 family protein
MLLIRKQHLAGTESEAHDATSNAAPDPAQPERSVAQLPPTMEETVRDLHTAGHSQRSIARDLNIDRRKVKQIIDAEAA